MSARTPILRRLNPRRRTLLKLSSRQVVEGRVENLSVDGLFLRRATLGDARWAELSLPGRDAPVGLDVRRAWQRDGGTAVQFELRNAADRRALAAHVHYQREQERVQAMEGHLGVLGRNLKPVSDEVVLGDLLRAARTSHVALYRSADRPPVRARLVDFDRDHGRIGLDLPDDAPFEPFREVVVIVPGGSMAWLADTFVDRVDGRRVEIVVPERLFVPERRTAERDRGRGTLVLASGSALRVLDHGPDGLRVSAEGGSVRGATLGTTLEGAVLHGRRGPEPMGALRVAWSRADGERTELGLERVTPRIHVPVRPGNCVVSRPGPVQRWAAALDFGLHTALGKVGLARPAPAAELWPMAHPDGRALVALLDVAGPVSPDLPMHVVLVPPAYGRRKEHPASLAKVIAATFAAARLPVAVVRWDGVNHVGESGNEAPSDHPMLRYTQTQSVADLGLVCAEVARRFPGARRTAAVTFSLSAVATRSYLARGGAGIDVWIAPMGAADARDTIRNGSGGHDLVGERQAGKALGYQLLQGHLVDADRHCDDLIDGGFADLADARRDMAKIQQPVLWLVGTHDYWVNRKRVEDVMSVPAPGRREILEVPTGHQLRASEEALATFRLIAERLLSDLSGRSGKGVVPPGWQLFQAEQGERARLADRPFDAAAYWHDYLVGRDGNPFGFDLLTLTEEYQDLVDTQIALLDPAPGARIVDLGCGTGNLLLGLASLPASGSFELDAVDFVPEALDRVWAKMSTHAAHGGRAPAALRLHRLDLSLKETANLPFADSSVDCVMLSLVLPYLTDPGPLLAEACRVLRPGGVLVASTLRPDADMSGPVERLRQKIDRGDTRIVEGWTAPQLQHALRAYINDAAALLDGEVRGRFRFFADTELSMMLSRAGFRVESVQDCFGAPAMACVARARRPGA